MSTQRWDVAFECPEIIGIPVFFTVSNRNGLEPFATEVTLNEAMPLDLLLYGLEFTAIDSTGAKTDLFGINIRDSQSEDWWYYTAGNQGRGAPVNINLIAGDSGSEFIWPAPRIVRETSRVFVKIVPNSGVTIKYIKLNFHGRRLRGDEAIEKLCERASRTGYGSIAFPALAVPIDNPTVAADKNGIPSPQVGIPAPIDALPYDFFISGISVFIGTDQDFTPLQGAEVNLTLAQDVGRNELFFEGLSSSVIGGQRKNETGVIGDYRAVEHQLKACWRVFQESTLKIQAEHIYSPAAFTGATIYLYVVLHGQRGVAQQLPPFGARRWLFARPDECPDPRNEPMEAPEMAAWGHYVDKRMGESPTGRTDYYPEGRPETHPQERTWSPVQPPHVRPLPRQDQPLWNPEGRPQPRRRVLPHPQEQQPLWNPGGQVRPQPRRGRPQPPQEQQPLWNPGGQVVKKDPCLEQGYVRGPGMDRQTLNGARRGRRNTRPRRGDRT